MNPSDADFAINCFLVKKKNIRLGMKNIHSKDVDYPQVPVEIKPSIMCNKCNVNFSSIGKYREHRNVVHNIQISKCEYISSRPTY